MTLIELAERVEAAEGPDRELDCLIGVAIGRFFTEPNKGWPDRLDYVENRDGGHCHPGHGFDQLVPRYTASIDAALTPVDDELVSVVMGEALARLDQRFNPMDNFLVKLRLFVCAAALRARASS